MVDYKIELLDPSVLLPCPRLYSMNEDELKAVKALITDYFAKGWIWPSTSLYVTPVIVICKKTGELCIVIDYCILNKKLILIVI